jgi:O-antigen ligase
MNIRGLDIKKIPGGYHILFLFLIAILLPFRAFGPGSGFNPLPLIIIIWSLIWFLDMSIGWQWPRFRLTLDALLPLGFVLISILSLMYSENLSDGWNKIQVRLALLFMPILIIGRPASRSIVRIVLRSFIISNAIASLILLIRATTRYSEHGWHSYFYSEFSYFLHPSYFALYLLICIIFLLMLDGNLAWPSWLRFTLAAVFFIIIFFTSSRAGILATVIVVLYAFIRSPLIKRVIHRILLIALLFLMSISAFLLNYRTNPTAIDATNALQSTGSPGAALKTVESKSSPARIMIWNSALELIKADWFIGYGIGDAQDMLTAKYHEKGFDGPAAKRLNAHNQYLQSMIETGVPGIIALLLLLLPLKRLAGWRGSRIGIAILAALGIHLLFESMLNTQAGVLLLAWILALMPYLVDFESERAPASSIAHESRMGSSLP